MKFIGSCTTDLSALVYATIVLVVVAISSSDDWLRSTLLVFYALQYFFIVRLALKQKDRWLFILSPSFVTASYIAINSCLGAHAFSLEKVVVKMDYQSYLEWTNLGWVVAFMLCANLVVILPYFLTKKKHRVYSLLETRLTPHVSPAEKILVIGFCASLLLLFSTIKLDLSIFGATTNFSIIPQTLAALSIVIVLVKSRQRGRYAVYLLILFYFASFSSFDKRNALFLIAPIVLIECLRMGQLRLRPRVVVATAVLLGVVLMLVVMMSIYRGYGNYQPVDFFDTRNYILDYVKNERFYPYLGNNLEFNYAFFHSHQAIEYVYNTPELLLYGSTFLKILFVPFPRYLFPSKPDSIIVTYTNHHAPPGFPTDERSWLCSIYCDFFWNFHFGGLFALLLTFYLATRCYLALAYRLRQKIEYEHLLALFAYQQMLHVIRGSGFDYYGVALLLATGFVLVGFLPIFKIFRAIGYQKFRTSSIWTK